MNHFYLKKIIPLLLIGMMLSIFSGALCGQTLQIHYINVQQGQSTLIIGPNGTTILFDGGYETKGTTEVVPYLQSIGIPATQTLNYIIASHRDTDHYVGLTEVINYGYNAYHVYDNGSDKTNTYWVAFVDAVTNHTTAAAVTAISLGTVIDLGYGVTATCVAANGSVVDTGAISGATDENDRAICLLIKYNDFDFLLNGDMGGGAADNACTGRSTSQVNMESPTVMAIMPAGIHPLLSQYGVEVAHVGHHGSESSTNSDYMNILTPRVACISVGAGQDASYQHPRVDVVEHVLLAGSSCITASAALVLQTEEGNPITIGGVTSQAGNCVGDIVISTDGINSYTVSADGAVSQGPDERVAAGLPVTYNFEEYLAVDNAPIIYNVHSENITTTTADIVWKTNETANSVVRYGTTSGSYTNTASNASLVLNHLIALSGLTDSTTYYYVVDSTDATSHTTTSQEYSFQTLAVVSNTITVTSPNGGESWLVSTTHNITWTSTGTVGSLNIDYSIDGGTNWTAVATGEANDSSYTWTVPNTASTNCLVRVQETDGSPTDSSNAAFTITVTIENTITVTSPNGGESWTVGGSQDITWTSTGTVGNVNIDYSIDGGTNWISITTGEANDGSYNWTIPDTVSTTCLVRVQETDGSPTDSSNAVFSITATSPVAGVIFSEVYYDTIGTDSVEEWIELYNKTDAIMNIGGWRIQDNNGTASTWVTIPAGTTIAPYSYLTVAANSAGFRNIYGYEADIYYGTVIALGNSGDALLLKDSSLNLIDTVAWEGGTSGGVPAGWGSTTLPTAATGYTIVRSDVTVDTDTYADWTTAANNGFPQTQLLSSPIIFSEVYYDTVGTDSVEEWIELYNKAPIAVDIGGCTITDNNGTGGTYTIPAGTTMAPHSYLTIAANSTGFNALYGYEADIYYGTVMALGNSGDALLLKDSLGVLRDAVAWEGGTAAGVPDGWGSTTLPTAATGYTIVRSDITIDTNTYADWTTAANNGNPQNQADLFDTIAITSPNGGESWMASTSHDITWTSEGTVGSLTIDYSIDGGTNWITVATGEANDGSYTWTVPNTASTNCLVRVQEADGSPRDSSDAVFSIIVYVPETVSAPTTLTGPTSGTVGTSYGFTVDGSISSYGDSVQYLFDWGDGTDSGWLDVGIKTASHSWATDGTHNVQAKARCASHTSIESAWSTALIVVLEDITPDFNNDNKVDILWRNILTGENRVWLMDGVTLSSEVDLDSLVNPAWTIVGCGDFNNDQNTDILWRNALTGKNRVWLMDGVTLSSEVDLDSLTGWTWTIVGCGDFNNDQNTDILWRNTLTGKNRVWLMDGLTRSSVVDLDSLFGLAWAIVGCGDFNGDHKTDILWRNALTGKNTVWLMDGVTRSSVVNLDSLIGAAWAIVGCGDFNGDQKTDILWRNMLKGENLVWLMDGVTRSSVVYLDSLIGPAWQVVN